MDQNAQVTAERVAVVGHSPRTEALLCSLRRYAPEAALDVVGCAGGVAELTALLALGVDVVVVGVEAAELAGTAEALAEAVRQGVRVEAAETLFERYTLRAPSEECGAVWAAELGELGQAAYLSVGKRVLDVVVTLLVLLPGLVVAGLAALAVQATSGGPVLFRQRRVGRHGREFTLLKLRTMEPGAEADTGPVFCADGDPRVTPVGHLLRRYGIDELPQLLAVLRGEMSLVGPRPERPRFVEQFRQEVPLYDARHLAPPGLTGWAQVNLKTSLSPSDAAEKLRFDLYYLRHASAALDLQILWRTACVLLARRRSAGLAPQ